MDTGNLMVDAQTAFVRERRKRRRARFADRVLRRPRAAACLQKLNDALGGVPPARRRQAVLRPIPLESIVGTAESAKARTFDASFRPAGTNRRRWEGLWMAERRGTPLPPISVYRLGDSHFVNDGHHRVSVARALGVASIDAEVIEL
jgi:hypothetical protein